MATVSPKWWSQLWWRPTNKTHPMGHHYEKEFYEKSIHALIPELACIDPSAYYRKFCTAWDYMTDTSYSVHSKDFRGFRPDGLRRDYRTVATIPLFSAAGEVKITYDDGEVKVSSAAPLLLFNIYKSSPGAMRDIPGVIISASNLRELCENENTINNRTQYMLINGTMITNIHHNMNSDSISDGEFMFDVGSVRKAAKVHLTSKGYVPEWMAHRMVDYNMKFITSFNRQAILDALNKDVIKLVQERDEAIETIREICKKYV
jgi:hypothetical protein